MPECDRTGIEDLEEEGGTPSASRLSFAALASAKSGRAGGLLSSVKTVLLLLADEEEEECCW